MHPPALPSIDPLDNDWFERARAYHDTLTKPQGSLGRLESLGCQLCGIQRRCPPDVERRRIVVMAGDHGVTETGVSAYPSSVTTQMMLNFAAGGAAINALARVAGAELEVVNVGVAGPCDRPEIINACVAPGTANFVNTPAMTELQVAQAVSVGLERANQAKHDGIQVIALGEMGIGNTTSASAITAALSGISAHDSTGIGTGINAETWTRKVAVVETALARHMLAPSRPWDILRCVGGFEIAALCGLTIGCAAHRIAVVTDGFVATSAVALACRIEPSIRGYLIAGHRSVEPGHIELLRQIDLAPWLDLGLRLGEGTGAALALHMITAAAEVLRSMATFASAGVNKKV